MSDHKPKVKGRRKFLLTASGVPFITGACGSTEMNGDEPAANGTETAAQSVGPGTPPPAQPPVAAAPGPGVAPAPVPTPNPAPAPGATPGPVPAGGPMPAPAPAGPSPAPAPTPTAVPAVQTPPVMLTAVQGLLANATTGTWTNDPVSYERRFYVNGNDVGSTYDFKSSDVGKSVSVEVSATNAIGESPPATSDPQVVKSAGSLPAWVGNLPLWQWHRIPNTKMNTTRPAKVAFGSSRGRVEAWCGATLNPLTSTYFVVAAGGHGNYSGNETVALNLNSDNPTWVMLDAGSKQTGSPSNPDFKDPRYKAGDVIFSTDVYADLKPNSPHTYSGNCILPNLGAAGKLLQPGLGGAGPAGNLDVGKPHPPSFPFPDAYKESLTFDLATNTWDYPSSVVAAKPAPFEFSVTEGTCCQHPVSGDVYQLKRRVGYKWRASDNTWTKFDAPGFQSGGGMAIDPTRDRGIIIHPNGFANTAGRTPKVLNLTSGAPVTDTSVVWPNPQLLEQVSKHPALHYIPSLDSYIVLWNRSHWATDMMLINAETFQITIPTVARDPSFTYPGNVKPNEHGFRSDADTKCPARATDSNYQNSTGTHNAAQYVPKLGGIVMNHKDEKDVWFIRLHAV